MDQFCANNVPMVYGQIDITPLIAGRFEFLFRWYFNQALSYYEAIEEAVKKWNPRCLQPCMKKGLTDELQHLLQDSPITFLQWLFSTE